MNSAAVKAGFAPFIHSGRDIKKWYFYLIAGILPGAVVVCALNPASLLTLAVSTAGFLGGGVTVSYWKGRDLQHPEIYLKYILWALFFTVFTAGTVTLAGVFLVSALSSAAVESVSPFSREIFPSFLLGLLLVYSFFDFLPLPPENTGMIISLAGGVVLVVINRVLPLRFLFGIAVGAMFSWIFIPSLRVVLPLLTALTFAPPGFIPEGGAVRFGFGALAGALAGFLGLPGLFIAFVVGASV